MPIYPMTPEGNRPPAPRETDPEKLAKLLEMELIQKRAGWQQAKARRSTYRTMSFLFLFAVILAAFAAFYFLAAAERIPAPRPDAQPTASP
jgi:hypothetical protein